MAIRGRHETNIEESFRTALENRGLRRGIDFATQYPLRNSFILDFAFPEQKIAVEVDGSAWHSSGQAKRRDAFKDKVLGRLGWTVLRFREGEIMDGVELCVNKVLALLPRSR